MGNWPARIREAGPTLLNHRKAYLLLRVKNNALRERNVTKCFDWRALSRDLELRRRLFQPLSLVKAGQGARARGTNV